ncbi:MAG: glycosyltransferase family 2 protein, partial [Eubacteriales bacterium]
MNKKVSIIIPIYNVERYIDQCVKCVLDQSYVFTEVILSDDGSTDSSGAICDDWAKKDKRIKVIHDENRGASMARNRGIDLATGNYIIFLDSDDYWEGENVLAEMMAQLEQSDADMLVFGYSKLFEPQGTIKAITPIGKRSEVVGKPKSEAFDYLTTLNIHVASP